jgi:predicted ATPase
VLVHLQGSGLRGLLPILAALTHPNIQVVLIDEPEISLEPRLQKVLRDVLVEKSEQKVIVIATHSHLFLHRDVTGANQVVSRSAPNETLVRTLAERSE